MPFHIFNSRQTKKVWDGISLLHNQITMKNNFMQRAITGIIFVAVLIGCILGGPISFGILFAIISAAAINEFGNLVNKQEDVQMNKRI